MTKLVIKIGFGWLRFLLDLLQDARFFLPIELFE